MRIRESVVEWTRGGPVPGFIAALLAGLSCALPVSGQPAPGADSSFQAFLTEFEDATRAFLDGDVTAWRSLLSPEPGATLLTPFGGLVLGPSAVEDRYRRAAARFAPGPARLDVEYLHVEAQGDLAYVTSIERSSFRRPVSDSTSTGYTRATMVFRLEAGGWKLRHRHTDHLHPPAEP